MSRHVDPAHKRAVRAMGYALTLGDTGTWILAGGVWSVRLTHRERVCVAYTALLTLPDDMAAEVASAALSGAGGPSSAFFGDALNEALEWASFASETELKAYAFAAARALPRRLRRDLIEQLETMNNEGR